jgi:hypothetical protein
MLVDLAHIPSQALIRRGTEFFNHLLIMEKWSIIDNIFRNRQSAPPASDTKYHLLTIFNLGRITAPEGDLTDYKS